MIRNEKRWRTLLLALLAAMLVSALAPTQALAKTGWVKQSNGKYRYYETDDYYYYDEFAEIDGIWYRFNSNGYYLTGWYDEQDDYGDEYDGWYPVVYFKSNGAAATGWNKISGKWYYFKEYSDTWPDMLRNGAYWINKAWYVLRADGSLVDTAGWQKIISSYDGVEYTDWYYTKASGVAYTGWRKIGGSWYYFDPDSARMVGDYILEIGGKSYAFKPSGAMATGWHKFFSNSSEEYEWVYAGSDGALKRGWQKVGGSWYYFEKDKASWPVMFRSGLYKIGKAYYYFNKGGDMATGWKKISGKWYYFGASGAMVKSKWVGNYYLKADGTMAVSEWVDGDKYYVDGNGKWVKGKTK